MLEIDFAIFVTILVLLGGVSFFIGSTLAPTARGYREEAKYYRGLYGKFKKKEHVEVEEDGFIDNIMDALGDNLPDELRDNPLAKTMIKKVLEDPEQLKKMFGGATKDEQTGEVKIDKDKMQQWS